MRKRLGGGALLVALALFICVGIVITILVRSHYQQITLKNNRHALFCEKIKQGMSPSEVSDILNETGNVIIRLTDSNSHYEHYSILFTDEDKQDLYGGWTELLFIEGKYSRSYIEGFELESIDVICDFSQATESISATSKP